ncbi:MAG TPA: LysR family transcriptional regulator, partial [Plasticicumulans sp.]|nr:LysR family transcriptional regulator [Plasticicumulans sp.]
MSALHLYAVLVEAGSFTRAADRLGCTKGHVSKQLAALERSLGMQLLHRSTRRLAPTAAGSALLPLARRLTAVDDE